MEYEFPKKLILFSRYVSVSCLLDYALISIN